jgi:2-amino-4-hydroxy-6-hydroxymethyldihydropteridine diphosphokinase
MSRVFIGLGSNEGDRIFNLSEAARRLGALPGIRLVQMAPIYETEPLGPPQAKYLNTVIELDTARVPAELLAALKRVEQELGRLPSATRWAPRPIDLDILLYDDRVVSELALRIPHPEMHRRRFVLEPLAQLAPEVIHPTLHLSISELLQRMVATPP